MDKFMFKKKKTMGSNYKNIFAEKKRLNIIFGVSQKLTFKDILITL